MRTSAVLLCVCGGGSRRDRARDSASGRARRRKQTKFGDVFPGANPAGACLQWMPTARTGAGDAESIDVVVRDGCCRAPRVAFSFPKTQACRCRVSRLSHGAAAVRANRVLMGRPAAFTRISFPQIAAVAPTVAWWRRLWRGANTIRVTPSGNSPLCATSPRNRNRHRAAALLRTRHLRASRHRPCAALPRPTIRPLARWIAGAPPPPRTRPW